ncbi:hypothetical protein SAMN05444320_11495 [Streptoalloteichus hindustanus]|uniref:Uncharacterized protein n=2 Tax=Streptoalloteichus hindustanus TaxID=2017 RepID=A0A1M5MXZ0_STRHI|nr:hypothetical protein SAMN05444320_11495 [Streptoalloteichus hindustanus]
MNKSDNAGPRSLTRPLVLLLLALVVGWLVLVVAQIGELPASGRETPDKLRAAVADALGHRSADELQELFSKESAGKKYAETYLKSWESLQASDVRVELSPDTARVLVAATAGDGNRVCVGWPVAQQRGLWYLEGVPALQGVTCST